MGGVSGWQHEPFCTVTMPHWVQRARHTTLGGYKAGRSTPPATCKNPNTLAENLLVSQHPSCAGGFDICASHFRYRLHQGFASNRQLGTCSPHRPQGNPRCLVQIVSSSDKQRPPPSLKQQALNPSVLAPNSTNGESASSFPEILRDI